MYQSAPGKPYNKPAITVNGQRLQAVDKFAYLGSTLSIAVHIDDEVTARIAKASVAFGRLCGNVWDRSGISMTQSWSLQSGGTANPLIWMWDLNSVPTHAIRLNHFHLSCLRNLLKIWWQVKIPDIHVLKITGMQSVHTLLKLAQLRYIYLFIYLDNRLRWGKICYR